MDLSEISRFEQEAKHAALRACGPDSGKAEERAMPPDMHPNRSLLVVEALVFVAVSALFVLGGIVPLVRSFL